MRMKRIFEAVLFSFLVELSQFTLHQCADCVCVCESLKVKNKALAVHTVLAVIRIFASFFIPFSSFSLGFSIFFFSPQKDNSARHFDWPLSSRRSVRLQKGNKIEE